MDAVFPGAGILPLKIMARKGEDRRMLDLQGMARSAILNTREYVPGKPVETVKRECGMDRIIKLDTNENPLGPSPLAVEAMIREIRKSSHLYPESLCPELIAKLSARFSLPAGSFYMGNGADAVITMMGLTFLNPGDEVVFPELSFPAYDNIGAKMGATRVRIPMRPDFTIDTDAMARAVTPRTKLVFLCNPNNPTGLMTDKKEFEAFLARMPETALVVSDEAYWEFADPEDYPNSLEYLKTHRNLIVLRSFSKVMGLAGLRIGYAMADPKLVRVMMKAREPFPVNRIAQAGALAALDDHEFIEKTKHLNREGLAYFYEFFGAMGLTCYRSSANFVMVDVGRDADLVFGELLKKGIIVRPLKGQGVETGLRITVGLMEENRMLIQALKDILF